MSSHTELYEVLGVDPSTPTAQIRRKYLKLSKQFHPDRNPGDAAAAEKMQEISAAWDVLQDDEKRALYDRYGLEGLQGGGGGGGGGFGDIFDMFGGGGRSRGPPTKTQDMKHGLGVDLGDLYRGKARKLRITRSVLCSGCKGKGGVDGKEAKKCASCSGQGVKVMMRQIGPGMMQQMHVACEDCAGEGELLDAADRCTECKGKKLVEKSEEIEVNVRPGMKHGEPIVLHGMANEAPGLETGDIIFVVQEGENDEWDRRGDDLFIKRKISLLEALTGFAFPIKTLDGRELNVTSREGQVLAPGHILGISDEGMPRNKNPSLKGNLYIEFEIIFPDVLDADTVASLKETLPPSPLPAQEPAGPDAEEVHLNVNYVEGGNGESYDEDQQGGGPGGVQCAQQ